MSESGNEIAMETTMEEEEEPQGEACRLCDESTDKMVSVFDKIPSGKLIVDVIKEFLPIFIFKTDPHSKTICEDCLNSLENMEKFKMIAKEVNGKNKIKSSAVKEQTVVAAHDEDNNGINDFALVDGSTSTEDLPVLCAGCKQAVVDASTVNGEVELNGDLQKIVVEVLNKQRKLHHTDPTDKVSLRNRRKKPQPFYHELDDSICSSMTEFTQNTESSRFEYQSDVDSMESSDRVDSRKSKRRRADSDESGSNGGVPEKKKKLVEEEEEDEEADVEFQQEMDYRYQPMSLLALSLNVINGRIVPGYKGAEFLVEEIRPKCRCCNLKFQNTKILALHEVNHMDVVLEDKIDNPTPWPESRDSAPIRNKWLAYFDENGYEEDDLVLEESLLIPREMSEEMEQEEDHFDDLVTLIGSKPFVRGIPLQEFTKEERKNFYQSIMVGTVKKRFCQICRYIFKDNWAIESHYFSSACYYTCKYCGMRFNKQRVRFEEHITVHMQRRDPVITDKIYAPSKVNNFMPKIIQANANKIRPAIQHDEEEEEDRKPLEDELPINPALQAIKSRFSKKPMPSLSSKDNAHVPGEATSKSGNQAFFCRKCYKVFFKLDEFNTHSKNCNFNQFPLYANVRIPQSNNKPTQQQQQKNGENRPQNRTSRPTRHCARDVGTYKDEAYIPEVLLKKETTAPPPPPRQTVMAGPPFICFICNTPFPTIYSRNSHMRIHKGEQTSAKRQPPPNNHFTPNHHPPKQQRQNYPTINNEPFIKQEPLEPEVQIHESEPVPQISSIGGGAVSITPIPKKNNQRMIINPDIYKLVQDNPNISLKKASDKPQQMQAGGSQMVMVGGSPQEDKSYKCSSCWEAFANKSHLYFHKKNQCEGSRFPCPFCKKRFGTEAAYSSHIFYSHPE